MITSEWMLTGFLVCCNLVSGGSGGELVLTTLKLIPTPNVFYFYRNNDSSVGQHDPALNEEGRSRRGTQAGASYVPFSRQIPGGPLRSE